MIDRPLCGCGAGFCRLDVVTAGGPNFGRKFYVCPIKKGQGACNYFMWQDADSNVAAPGLRSDERVTSPLSTSTNFTNLSLVDSDLVKESQPINLGQENISQCSNNLSPTSGLLNRNKLRLGEFKGSEDISDEPSKRYSKWLRQGDSESDGSPSSSCSLSPIIPLENLASSPTLETEFHHGQMGSWKHHHTNEETISLTAYENLLFSCHHASTLLIDYEILRDTCWVLAAICENLRLQIQGWWGRLAFPPSKCLTEPALKPFFCSAPLTGSNAAEPVHSQGDSIMRKFVSKAFFRAAEQLQTDLLNILRPLDMKDHEIMSREANAAFNALDRLGTDHEKFREQVKEFILRASLLAKIDQSISSNQKLADRFNSQKLKFLEVKDAHAKVINALSASEERAAYLTEEISHLKDKLFQTEAELSCCKTESTSLKARISQMSKDKVKSEQSLQKTCYKLKNAWKLQMQMEAERQAAKTASEKAKVLLWG